MTVTDAPSPAVLRARTAVTVVFVMNGLTFASFIARAPAVREGLSLTTAQLGLVLLCMSAGAVSGLLVSGAVVARLGPARSVIIGSLLAAAGLTLLGVGLLTALVAPAAVGLAFTGFGVGLWDVAMNVEGADVEHRLGRAIMPRLHAAFSVGTIVGAGLGAGAAALAVPLAVQVIVIGLVSPVLMSVAGRAFLGRTPASATESTPFSVLHAWREPRTLVLGLMVLAFAFTEGTANDWIAVALVDGYGAAEATGAVAFGCFVAAMTVGRWFGTMLLDRFGRVTVLRVTAIVAFAGLLMVVLGGPTPVGLAGALLWGLGASLGFPVGMSAAADDPTRAAVRVSAVGTIGYLAFLAGPPLIGPLAQHVGIRTALLVVVGALALGLLASGAARPLTQTTDKTA